jgi:hypothetical protein
MLTLFQTSIKTSFIVLLFTLGISFLSSGIPVNMNQDGNGIPDQTSIGLIDTIKINAPAEKKEIIQETGFKIPDNFTKEAFDFQVNSDISYYRFRHFVKSESKKLFFQAWLKEKEAEMLLIKTDSLRKAYADSSSDQKKEVASQILKAEEQSITLNEEIPVLYEKSRDEEIRYWQLAPTDEKAKFQEKIRLFKDSIRQMADLKTEQTNTISQKLPDTFTYFDSSQKEEIKTEATSGVIYKIQVGSFKGKVPVNAAQSIKKLSVLRKVENHKDEKGVKIYTTGSLKKYQEAVLMQNQVKQEGIKNATIVAFQNGKKITVIEARKINKEL